MPFELLVVIGIASVAYALVGGAIGHVVPAPLFFAAVGVATHLLGLGPDDAFDSLSTGVIVVAIAVLLFTDAARLRHTGELRDAALEARMLLVTMPLTIVGVVVAGVLLRPDLELVVVVLLAGVLSPTDAALADPVLHDERVPEHQRNALVVEAGLNDGLATPVIAIAAATAGIDSQLHGLSTFGGALAAIVLGVLVGAVTGAGVAWLTLRSEGRGWASRRWEAVSLVGIAMACYFIAEELGGIALVAVFVAGLAYHAIAPRLTSHTIRYAEQTSELLSSAVFAWFGLVAADVLQRGVPTSTLVIVGLLLFVLRPAATWVATVRAGLRGRDRLLLGWYGPRGIASILFVSLLATEGQLPDEVAQVTFLAVAASLVLHGLTAGLAPRLVGSSQR